MIRKARSVHFFKLIHYSVTKNIDFQTNLGLMSGRFPNR
jgi:hypothetical protein